VIRIRLLQAMRQYYGISFFEQALDELIHVAFTTLVWTIRQRVCDPVRLTFSQ